MGGMDEYDTACLLACWLVGLLYVRVFMMQAGAGR